MTITVGNIRLGFATNSSSSHSIVIVPAGIEAPAGENYTPGQFGWENFVLAGPDEKMNYLAATVGAELRALYGADIARAVMKEWFAGVQWDDDWYVDHASVLTLPYEAGTSQISKAFMEALRTFLLRDDVMVLGGNDNQVDAPLKAWKINGHPIVTLAENSTRSYARQSGDWWTLFNPQTGAKLRLSFAENPAPFTRAISPELVDMKITDYCPVGCEWCYQDSTTTGRAAKLVDIQTYLHIMRDAGVFEVALGGGEPILHPDFPEIMERCRKFSMVPNLTTKLLPQKWSTEVRQAILRHAGAVAVSIADPQDVGDLHAFRRLYGKQMVAHYVVGIQNDSALKRVIDACRRDDVPLTLLGYKETGRGSTYPHHAAPVTAETLRKAGRLSVDTSFVKHYGEVLKEANVPDILFVPGEGVTSMYIDAVAKKVGRSSYEPESFIDAKGYLNLDDLWTRLGESHE